MPVSEIRSRSPITRSTPTLAVAPEQKTATPRGKATRAAATPPPAAELTRAPTRRATGLQSPRPGVQLARTQQEPQRAKPEPIAVPPNDLEVPKGHGRTEPYPIPAKFQNQTQQVVNNIRAYKERSGWDNIFESGRRMDVVRTQGVAGLMGTIRGGLELAWRFTAEDDYNDHANIPRVSAAVAHMFDELDFEGSAVFPDDVRSLTRRRDVRTYLRELTHALAEPQADPQARVQLWDFTLQHTKGNEQEAIKWLAVLFQDLEPVPTGQLALVEDPATQELLTLANIMVAANKDRISFYPDDFGWDNHLLYHFYVPAYTAQRLRKRGYASDQAFVPPYVMNSEYERIYLELSGDGKPGVHGLGEIYTGSKTAWSGPHRNFTQLGMDPRFVDQTIEDIYLGYRGALLGSGSTAVPMDFARFERGMRTNTRRTLQRLVEDVRRPRSTRLTRRGRRSS